MLDEIKENCPFKDDISVCEFCGRLSVCYTLKEIIEMDLQKRLMEVTDGTERKVN